MIILGLFGYGYFSYGTFGAKITKANPFILPFAIPLILPYIISSFLKIYHNKKEENKKKDDSQFLVNYGKKAIIDFKKSVKEIEEFNKYSNTDLEIIKYFIFFPLNNFTTQKIVVEGSTIKIEYKVNYKKYYKEFQVPFNSETTKQILKIKTSTVLYYDENNPSNSIIDLKFLEEFL